MLPAGSFSLQDFVGRNPCNSGLPLGLKSMLMIFTRVVVAQVKQKWMF
jgi:hypothetical protein